MSKSLIKIVSKNGSIKALSPAKINLFLEVIGQRRDGYHEIRTVMQCVDLFDELTFTPTKKAIKITSNCKDIPTGRTNTVYKAISLLKDRAGLGDGVAVSIKKKIPIGAGLGGGSSNAATAIIAMNRMFNLKLSRRDMNEIAQQVGSDVPFFLNGSTALCTGRGEKVQPLKISRKMHYVLVYPNMAMSTKKVYEKLRIHLTKGRVAVKIFCNFLLEGSLQRIGNVLFNELEYPAFALNKKLKAVKTSMQKVGFLGVLMTGSGSGIFGLCKSKVDAMKKAKIAIKLLKGNVFVLSSV